MNQSVEYLKAIHSVWVKALPDSVLTRARESLLDYLAVTCAGARFQQDKLDRYRAFAMPEKGDYKAIGLGTNFVLKEAVFLNGLNGHALDFDDGTNAGIIHLGSPIFSLLIPLAQKYQLSIDKMLRAAIIGYEASYTLAVSIQPKHKQLGYHATGTCGTIGAVIAGSYMLGFTEKERFRAFAAACVAASGMLKALDEGSELKPYNVAKASLLALTSLQMGKSGFEGAQDPLGGRGFLRMMTGLEAIDLKPVLLNGTYAIMKTYTKPYASCRYTHPAVEAAIRMRDAIDPTEVINIEIKTYDLAVSGHAHTDVTNGYSAKMSIPYATAVGLVFGKAGLQEFSDTVLSNALVRELTRKTKVVADSRFSKAFPGIQAAEVIVTTKDGSKAIRVDIPKGEPENPLTGIEFRSRYDDLMNYAGIDYTVSSSVFNTVYRPGSQVDDLVKDL